MKFIVLIFVLSYLGGCATASHTERDALLAEPINCETAEEDILALKSALPSKGERARSAIQTVTPVGLVTGVATQSYKKRAAVLSGRTEDELQARIKQIREACEIMEILE